MKKQTWSKLSRIAKTLWAVVFGFATVVYIIMAFIEVEMRAVFIVLAVIFGFLTFLLARKKKPKAVVPLSTAEYMPPMPELGVSIETQYIPEIPEETLKHMRRYYTAIQASDDARILSESFQLCQQTTNFDTFSSRLELAQQKIFTLLQAHRAGCKGIQPGTVETCIKALDAVPALKIDYLSRVYIKETSAALMLKTPAGQRRRLEALLEDLQSQETFYMDVEDAYNKTLEDIKVLMS